MKQIKKILCGMLLTSFVILGSINVLANGRGGVGSNTTDCVNVYNEATVRETTSVESYTETSTGMSFNAESSWDYNENQTVICS